MDCSLGVMTWPFSDQISICTAHKSDFVFCRLEPPLLFLTCQGQLRKLNQQVTEEKCSFLKSP